MREILIIGGAVLGAIALASVVGAGALLVTRWVVAGAPEILAFLYGVAASCFLMAITSNIVRTVFTRDI